MVPLANLHSKMAAPAELRGSQGRKLIFYLNIAHSTVLKAKPVSVSFDYLHQMIENESRRILRETYRMVSRVCPLS